MGSKWKQLFCIRVCSSGMNADLETSSLPPAPNNHYSTFYLYGFDYSGYFILVESYSICPFVTWHVSEFPSFLRQNSISLYGYNTVFLHPFGDGHLGFHLLAVVNTAATNIRVQVSV